MRIPTPPPTPSTEGSQTSTTHSFFETTKSNKEGKESHKASSPHHISFQNLTFLPLPMENTMLLLNNDPSFLISFHNPTPNPSLPSRVYYPPSSAPYFLLITCFQRVSLSSMKRQLHLHKRALLSVERYLKPNPPLLLSEHTTTHLTRWVFCSKAPPPPKGNPFGFAQVSI